MAMEYKDFFPAKNADSMRNLVVKVDSVGNQLKPVLDDFLARQASSRVKENFRRLSSLITACTTASTTFESRLKVVLEHEAPARMAQAERLRSEKFVSPTKQVVQAAEHQSDKHLKETGGSTHAAAAAAEKNATAHTKKTEQLAIGFAVLKIAGGLFLHIPLTLIETGKAAIELFSSSKGGQFKHGIERLAWELEKIEKLEEQLEDMCLFLYLVPTLTDLDKGEVVTESIAHDRLRTDLGLL